MLNCRQIRVKLACPAFGGEVPKKELIVYNIVTLIVLTKDQWVQNPIMLFPLL